MIDTVAFKTAIIDLAVTGQLSSQFHAEDSVKDIIAVLPSLSNKRKKLLGQNFEYGKQAVLPNHWQWVCLGKITSYGDTPKKSYFENVSGETWILDLEDIKSGGQITKKTRVHGKKFIGEKTAFSKGQVLYSKLRPYLKKVLVADEDGISTPELISFDVFGGMIPQYIVYCLLSSFTGKAIEKRSYGIKMPRIDADFMVNLPIPVPPISEQQFIVDRVQAAFSEIDTIDELQAKYADNLTVLKSKLIDLAIRGKLTEQLPEDGTAEELYQQIQAEKQALIQSGKIKKEKPLPEIAETEIPFEIPGSWKWVRLGEYCQKVTDQVASGSFATLRENVRSLKTPDYAIMVKTADFSNGFTSNLTYTDKHGYEFLSNSNLYGGELILSNVGSVGKCFIVPKLKYKMTLAPNAVMVRTIGDEGKDYLYYFLISPQGFKELEAISTGVAVKKFNKTELKKILIPLPPLAEQKQIVDRLDKLLAVYDEMR